MKLVAGHDRKRRTAAWSTAACIALLPLGGLGDEPATSPYTGQESRPIKALSADEIDELLSGAGMGFAKAAELNGFPGPRHVLDLEAELELTPEQKKLTQALFEEMQASAIELGKQLVNAEAQLEALFAQKDVEKEDLRQALDSIGTTRAALRYTHLEAHLRQTEMLTDDQIRRYSMLRGYHGDHRDHGH